MLIFNKKPLISLKKFYAKCAEFSIKIIDFTHKSCFACRIYDAFLHFFFSHGCYITHGGKHIIPRQRAHCIAYRWGVFPYYYLTNRSC